MINVTKSYLPNINKYKKYVDKIFNTNWLTNNGPLTQELEKKLSEYLGVNNILLVANGTLALQIAFKLLNLKGEVITTPFSFVATISSLIWENLIPRFVDINPQTLNINTEKIDQAISEKTSAILPVHVFGNACEVEKIETIAKRNSLKVIYDAAHAFSVRYKDNSILNYGDISILSFHATKIFHTIEGGALIINDDDLFNKAKQVINFGYENGKIESLGINAKMNEFEAAMGLCILDDIDYILKQNEALVLYYKEKLKDIVEIPTQNDNATNNHSYFPVIFKNEEELIQVQIELNQENIFPRRYFYPSLNTLPYLNNNQNMPISQDIASRILCLPLYSALDNKFQKNIINTIFALIHNHNQD